MKNIYLQLVEDFFDNTPLVLATVTGKKGSAPQVPGSSAIFGKTGLIAGTVGGGAVEGRIGVIALERLKSHESGYLEFNLHNDISKKEEAICGGQLNILVDADPMKSADAFRELFASIQRNQRGILLTHVEGLQEKGVNITRFWITDENKDTLPEEIKMKAGQVISEMLSQTAPGFFKEQEISGERESVIFIEEVRPPTKLVIAGAGHIGRSLSHLGNYLGFDVTVIDDREEFANMDNLPEANHIIVTEIGSALHQLKKDKDTYVVIVTRGHKDDAEALRNCIGSDLAYIGMIGSRHKIKAIREEFISKGWATAEQWDKIHSPIGLDINSKTIEEIAVSIAAQLVMVKNSGDGKTRSCPS